MSDSYERPGWVKQAIAAGGEFHAMKKEPGPHNRINLLATLAVASIFVGTIALGAFLPVLVYLPLAIVIFGCIYFAVNILVIHECSHNMFVLSRDRERQKRLNRLLGRMAALPFMTDYIRHWEKGHTIHHLRPCEADDPQDRDPITGAALMRKYLILLLIPLSFMAMNPSRQYPGNLGRAAAGIFLWWLPLGALTTWLVGWPVPVAMFLGLQVTMILNMTKKAQEHGGGLAQEPDFTLRSRTYLYPLSPVTSPFNINYHFEHHANFNVPWYDLRRYHARLLDIVPEQLKPYYFHHDFMAQLQGTKPLPPRGLLGIEVGQTQAAASR